MKAYGLRETDQLRIGQRLSEDVCSSMRQSMLNEREKKVVVLKKEKKRGKQKFASAGNRTRITRVGGVHSTIEPRTLHFFEKEKSFDD